MKHGYGEFQWTSGSFYKGQYKEDVKRGFGEMHWYDGCVFKGYWENGIQNGLGLMIFDDGKKRAGFFEENVFKLPLLAIEDIDQFEVNNKLRIPDHFRKELRELVESHNQQSQQELIDLVGQTIYQNREYEDATYKNALLKAQDMAND